MVSFIDLFYLFILDNFGDSDFDYLQKFGTVPTTDVTAGRDSVLLKFDPLLEKLKPIDITTPFTDSNRLSITKEEEEESSEKENSCNKQELSFSENSVPNLLPFFLSSDEKDNAEMKDLVLESTLSETIEKTEQSENKSIRYVSIEF